MTTEIEVINRLKDTMLRLLFDRDINVNELAQQTGVSRATVQRIVHGNLLVRDKSLQPIADFFKITLEQLKGNEPIFGLSDYKNELAKEIGVQRVPLLNWDAIEEWCNPSHTHASVSSDIAFVIAESPVSDDAFAAKIIDSAMEPVFSKGCRAIFDPEKTPKDRSYVLVKLATEKLPIFRQLILNGENKLLKPLSPDLAQYGVQPLSTHDTMLASLVEVKLQFNE